MIEALVHAAGVHVDGSNTMFSDIDDDGERASGTRHTSHAHPTSDASLSIITLFTQRELLADFDQQIQDEDSTTGYAASFSWPIFGTFSTTETGGRRGCNHRMSLGCLTIRWHKS